MEYGAQGKKNNTRYVKKDIKLNRNASSDIDKHEHGNL